jgi:NADH-quinone oxidoreductase chain G
MATRSRLVSAARRMSSLTVPTQRVVQPIGEDGLAILPKTLPIHKGKGEALIPKEGANYIEVVVDGNPVQIESGSSILQAIEATGINVPRFCFHERLSVAGNCRMCLVEIEKSPKPVASCAMPTMPGMKIFTNSPMVKKAREGVMEFLLANHPLDCPICDQGGECDLQDQAFAYGADRSRYTEVKRAVEDKNLGPLVKTSMTRCIHCTRCVRFSQEVAGVNMLGTVGRGNAMEISTYVAAALDSEMSGNVVDLCPVGALTSKPNAFAARSWEYRTTDSIDVLDGCGPSIQIDTAKGEVMRVQPRTNDDINEEWISDKTRYAVDGLKRQRLDMPLARAADGSLSPLGWREALALAADKLSSAPGKEIAAIAGPLVELEALVPLKDLINSLGSTSTLSTAAPLSADLRASYTLNASIVGLEQCDALLLVGTNPRIEAPLLNARIRKLVRHYGLPVASVGKAADLTYDVEHLGDSSDALTDLLAGKGSFASTLKGASKPAVLVGLGALSRPDGAAVAALASQVAISAGSLAEGWQGYSVLHSAGGAVGALDVGFVPGPSAVETSKAKVVYLLGADELPALAPEAFVIYQGHHGDAGAERADLILPGSAYTEKSGTYVNTEGRVQRTARALDAPGDAREDWTVLVALSKMMGKPLPYESLSGVRARMSAIAPQLADASGDEIEQSSMPMASLALEYVPPSAPTASGAALTSSMSNFYMSDVVSRASATMAKCVQAYGTRA